MNKLPKNPNARYTLTTDWKLDDIIIALNKRGVEIALTLDAVSKTNTISFNIKHRPKDKGLIDALLRTLYGGTKQG